MPMKRSAKVQKKIPRKTGTRKGKENFKNNPGRYGQNSVEKKTRENNESQVPDMLALSKNDIVEFCDRVLKKWQQDPVRNARNIPAMLAVRTSVFFSDEISLKAIWSEIISWVYQLLYENAQAQARKEGQEWARVFSEIKKP